MRADGADAVALRRRHRRLLSGVDTDDPGAGRPLRQRDRSARTARVRPLPRQRPRSRRPTSQSQFSLRFFFYRVRDLKKTTNLKN